MTDATGARSKVEAVEKARVRLPANAAARPRHGVDPGRDLRDGVGRLLSGGAARLPRRGGWVLDGPLPCDQRALPPVRGSHRTHGRRDLYHLAGNPAAVPHMLYAGSLVFVKPSGLVDLRDFSKWSMFMQGADWWHTTGPRRPAGVRKNPPVLHVPFCHANRQRRRPPLPPPAPVD